MQSAIESFHKMYNPDEKLQLDFAELIFDNKGRKISVLFAIDKSLCIPNTKMITGTSSNNVIIKLESYIRNHGVPKNIRFDQAKRLFGNKETKF